jgi:glycosyltransferase involved in cell wall biosynthesis
MSFYQQADVLVAHLKNDPAYEIARPSKIWEYMAVGKPVIYGGKGEGARIVEQSGGGIVVPPEQPSAMANAIMRIRKNTSDALLMGARGREYVLANFMRSQLNKPLVETVEEMIAQ